MGALNRGKPLARGAGLARTGSLARGASIPRTGKVKARRDPRETHDGCDWGCPCPRGRAREYAIFPDADLSFPEWEVITQMLLTRSGGRCEVCGKPFRPGVSEPNRHHRRSRGKGGTDDPAINGLANLLLVGAGPNARLGGVSACHGWIEHHRTEAEARGLIVTWGSYTAGGVPPEVSAPVTLHSGRRVLLDPLTARYVEAPAAA